MHDFWDTIKRRNLQIMCLEGEAVQAKGTDNIFNKIITENFPNLDRDYKSVMRQG
jgi:hypothetical protein